MSLLFTKNVSETLQRILRPPWCLNFLFNNITSSTGLSIKMQGKKAHCEIMHANEFKRVPEFGGTFFTVKCEEHV